MFLDFGWSELMLIGVVALVFIGPKDLPKALRVAGFWVRKARTLSREFQSSIDQMIREAELDDIRQELKNVGEVDLDHEFRQTIDPTGNLAEDLKPPQLTDLSAPERLDAPPAEGVPPSAAEMPEAAPPELVSPEILPPEPTLLENEQPETAAAPDKAVANDIVPPRP